MSNTVELPSSSEYNTRVFRTPVEPHTVWINPLQTSQLHVLFPLPLPGTDRINFEISYTNTLAGPLDTTRLIKAFQDALTYYPHASGRLRIKGNDWTIGQGKRGVPLTFAEIDEPFNHYEYLEAAPSELIDTCIGDISGAIQPSWDEPLLRVRVTYCRKSNETYIGWSSSHMLGDGEFVYQFLYAWSQYYQGKALLFGAPTYEKYRTAPTPELNDNPATAEFVERYLQHLKTLYPMDKWMGMVGDVIGSTSQVDMMFSAHQIAQFRAVADMHPGRKGTHASAQDAVSAYLITTLNRVLPTPIIKVSSMLSYRGIKNPTDLKADDWRIPGGLALGNAIFQAFTPTLPAEQTSSIGAVALAIRQSLKDTRKYDHVKRIVAVSEPIWMRQSTEQKEHKFWSDDGTFVINSMPKVNLNQLHFGYGPERTRVVLYGAFAGYARFFQAPPVKLPNGDWEANDGAMVMCVRVPTEVKDKFLARIAEDLNSGAFPQNLMWREREAQAKAAGPEKARL
ncbi:hypothetical protein FB45DRAFT_1063761 [Roridomyces roridus]|uniref:Uncharacterized protein n=1 Tax=Roridomyces roridus TaxID=1738132 RepID=A0AAD7FGJ1_9AGAR|nr:hypothetical protein FB45DRAFT_1063761 [Roridomyces roridus]